MSQKSTSLGVVFDASQVAPSAPMEALPPGWYPVVLSDGEVKDNNGNKRIALEWTVFEGQFKGRKIFDGFNIVHENPQAQEIAARDFSAVCHAVGVFQVQDVGQLFNKPHQIKVDVEPARTVNADGQTVDLPPGSPNTKTYEAKNRFKGAKAYVAGSAPSVATGTAPAAPAWAAAKPAGQGGSPSAPAWAAPAPGNAPVASPAVPSAAATATAPAAPVASSPTEPQKGKPGRKPKAAPAAPKVERKFFVGIDAPEFADALPESKLVEFFGKGMPADTPICLEGESEYKTAGEYGVGQAPAAPAPAPVAPPAPVVAPTVPAAPAAGNLPPWAR